MLVLGRLEIGYKMTNRIEKDKREKKDMKTRENDRFRCVPCTFVKYKKDSSCVMVVVGVGQMVGKIERTMRDFQNRQQQSTVKPMMRFCLLNRCWVPCVTFKVCAN